MTTQMKNELTITDWVSIVEEKLEEFNAEQIKEGSDNVENYRELLPDLLTYHGRLADVLEAIELPSYVLNERLRSMTASDVAMLEEFIAWNDDAVTLSVSHQFHISKPYELAVISLAEDEEELEHWLYDVPEELRQEVKEALSQNGSDYYYFDNTDVILVFSLDVDALSDYLVMLIEGEL